MMNPARTNTGHGKPERLMLRLGAAASLAAAYELFMLLPIGILIDHWAGVDSIPLTWFVGAAVLSAAVACTAALLPVWWKRWAAAAAMYGAVYAAAWMMASGGLDYTSFIWAAVLLLFFMQGMSVHRRQKQLWWYWMGVWVYFAASVGVHLLLRSSQLNTAPLITGGVVCLAIALFTLNNKHLSSVAFASDGRQVPGSMKRHNRLYVVLVLLFTLALAAGLGNLIARTLKHAFSALFGWLAGMIPKGQHTMPEQPTDMSENTVDMSPPPAEDRGLLDVILSMLSIWLAALIILAVTVWALYWFYKNRQALWRKWLDRLSRLLRIRFQSSREPAGFKDEETSLFSWEETLQRLRKNRIGRLFTPRRLPRYEDMPDNRARTRFLYRKWLLALAKAGYRTQSALTPLETARDANRWRQSKPSDKRMSDRVPGHENALLDLYYEVRYRESEPTDEQLKRLSEIRERPDD